MSEVRARRAMTVVLQVAASNQGGGNETKALRFHREFRRRKLSSWLALGRMVPPAEAGLVQISGRWEVSRWARLVFRFRTGFQQFLRDRGTHRLNPFWEAIAFPQTALDLFAGREDFNQPGSHQLLDIIPQRVDALLLHNVHARWNRHEGFFDLGILPGFSRQIPVILIPADMWLLTGHCAHSFHCPRWRTGCGQCPDLAIYPAVRRDSTAFNWRRKRDIFAHSRLFLAAPSRWLLSLFEESGIRFEEMRLIANGVDSDLFTPGSAAQARQSLGLTPGRKIILVSGNALRTNPWKGFPWLLETAQRLAAGRPELPVDFICVGDEGDPIIFNNARVVFAGHTQDPSRMAEYYRAADLYFHPSRADTAPFSVLEAMSTALPVVATSVGGIPEQVADGQTGFLVATGDSQAMAERIGLLLANPAQAKEMGESARRCVIDKFDFSRQVEEILTWTQEIVARENDSR